MKYGVCLEMFFTDLPFLQRIKKAADAGFQYAEMWFTDATADEKGLDFNDSKDPDKVRKAATQAGIVLTNAVIGSPDGSIGGGLTDAAKRQDWLKRVDETLAFCQAAQVGAAIVCTGNLVKGLTVPRMRQNVKDGLLATAERAEKAGINLFLEPLNDKVDHANYFLTGSDAGAALCREVHSPRLKLLFDCYHMQIMEGDLIGHIQRNLDTIGHFHAAGHPGRHELWDGETHYPFLIRAIEPLDYDGVFALEYMPELESMDSLRQALPYMAGARE